MYLLDTNVISELRRPRPHGAVVAWLEMHRRTKLYVSSVTIGELQSGVEALRGRDQPKAVDIEKWLDSVVRTYDILPVDVDAFRAYARLMCGRPKNLVMDALIAATALTRRLTVVTRDSGDFETLGVQAIDPFAFGQT